MNLSLLLSICLNYLGIARDSLQEIYTYFAEREYLHLFIALNL